MSDSREEGEKGVRCREKTNMTTSSLSVCDGEAEKGRIRWRRRWREWWEGEQEEEERWERSSQHAPALLALALALALVLVLDLALAPLLSSEGRVKIAEDDDWMDAIKEWLCFFKLGEDRSYRPGYGPWISSDDIGVLPAFSHTLKFKPTLDNT